MSYPITAPLRPSFAAPRTGAAATPVAERADPIDDLDAELTAILIDLQARARFGRIEGVAMPLLARAKALDHELRTRVAEAGSDVKSRYERDVARLHEELDTVECAFTLLRARG